MGNDHHQTRVKFVYQNGKLSPPAADDTSADDVVFTDADLMELNKELRYPGGYVKEIQLK
jgi:hypothetical protein